MEKGVLINPMDHDIQPIIINNSWIVKKNSSTHKSFDKCTEKDVRLVVGFDPINKFLQAKNKLF